MRTTASLAALTALAACHRWTAGESAPSGRCREAPITTGPRAECLAPPWMPGAAPDGGAAGGAFLACTNPRQALWALPGAAPKDDAAILAFLDRHRDELHALPGVESSGFGICCDGAPLPPKTGCLRVGVRLCTTSTAEVVGRIAALRASDPQGADLPLHVLFEGVGLLGPRCAGDACGPTPYDGPCRKPPATRRRIGSGDPRDPPCFFDGECVQAGCGNQCSHWTRGHGPGTCEYRMELAPAFCGCIDRACRWFR